MENGKNVLTAPDSLSQLFIPPLVLQTLPPETALVLCALPLARHDNMLIVAVADVENVDAIEQLKLATGLDVFPLQADKGDLEKMVEQYYDPTYPERKLEEEKYQQRISRLHVDLCKTGGTMDRAEKLFRLIIFNALRTHTSLITWKILANGKLDILYRIKGNDHVAMRPPMLMVDDLLRHVSKEASIPEGSEEEMLFGTIALKDEDQQWPTIAIAVDQTIVVQKTSVEPLNAEQIERVDARLQGMSFASPEDKLVEIILLGACICEATEILIEKSSSHLLLVFHLENGQKRLVMEAPATMFLPVLCNFMVRARQMSDPNFFQRIFRRKIAEPPLAEQVHGSFFFDDMEGNRHRLFYETRSFCGRRFLKLVVNKKQADWREFFGHEMSASPVHDDEDDR